MSWTIEIAKAFGWALAISLIFVGRLVVFNSSKAYGLAAVRAQGASLLLVGFFTVVFGVLLLRLNFVMDAGRGHFTLR